MEIDFNYTYESGFNTSFYAFMPKELFDGIKDNEIILEYSKTTRDS